MTGAAFYSYTFMNELHGWIDPLASLEPPELYNAVEFQCRQRPGGTVGEATFQVLADNIKRFRVPVAPPLNRRATP
jgi:hypothetical protein